MDRRDTSCRQPTSTPGAAPVCRPTSAGQLAGAHVLKQIGRGRRGVTLPSCDGGSWRRVQNARRPTRRAGTNRRPCRAFGPDRSRRLGRCRRFPRESKFETRRRTGLIRLCFAAATSRPREERMGIGREGHVRGVGRLTVSGRNQPVHGLQTSHPREMRKVVRHQCGIEGHGVGGNH